MVDYKGLHYIFPIEVVFFQEAFHASRCDAIATNLKF